MNENYNRSRRARVTLIQVEVRHLPFYRWFVCLNGSNVIRHVDHAHWQGLEIVVRI
jgi:hypothetical protein